MDPEPLPPDGDQRNPRPSGSFFSHHEMREVVLPQLSDEIKALRGWDHRKEPWRNTFNFYPEPLCEMENLPEITKEAFRSLAQLALTKWREYGSRMPKLYPSREEWEAFPSVRTGVSEALTLLQVRGLEGEIPTTRYFPNELLTDRLMEELGDLAKRVKLSSRMPQWGIPSHMYHVGMDTIAAKAASALFKAELEMMIYELQLMLDPTKSNETLIRNPQILWTYQKPLWKRDIVPPPDEATSPRGSLTSSFRARMRESHVAQRRPLLGSKAKSRRMQIPDIEEAIETSYDPNIFTPLPPLRTGRPPTARNTYTATPHLGLGRLGSSLFGPTHDEQAGPTPRRTSRRSQIEELPPLFESTPRRKRPKSPTPPPSDQSANSRTFQVPPMSQEQEQEAHTPPLMSAYQRAFGHSAHPEQDARDSHHPDNHRRRPTPEDESEEEEESHFEEHPPPRPPRPYRGRGTGQGGSPGDSSDENPDDRPPRRGPPGGGYPGGEPPDDHIPRVFQGRAGRGPPGGGPPPDHGPRAGQQQRPQRPFTLADYHFDPKLKTSDIPTWDGNVDLVIPWIKALNEIAEMSNHCYEQIGILAPKRLTSRALSWYQFLNPAHREAITRNWDTLKQAIGNHFCTMNWYNRLKTKALEARFRQPGYSSERPTDYYYRKLELLQTVHDWTEPQLVSEILDNAPDYWRTIIQTTNIQTLQQLSAALEHHEHTLIKNPEANLDRIYDRLRDLERGKVRKRVHQAIAEEPSASENEEEAPAEAHFIKENPVPKPDNRKNLIGAHPSIVPKHKPADHVISKGKTPKQRGVRPCRHCGSGNHYDYDCPHSEYQKKKQAFQKQGKKKGVPGKSLRYSSRFKRKAQANLAGIDPDAYPAFVAYEQAYLSAADSSDEESMSSSSKSGSDSENPEDFQ
jgi:hypothetical protein